MKPFVEWFGFKIDSYLLMMILGVLLSLAVVLLKNQLKKKDDQVSWKDICFLAIFVFVGALIGARILYFITRIKDIKSFDDVIKFLLTEGGLVFYGGVIGGVGFGILYLKIYKIKIPKFVQLIVPVIPLGHALGRVGCYLAGCCYGRLTDAEHGVHFITMPEGTYHIPVQLYEAIFLFVLFIILLVVEIVTKNKKYYLTTGLYFVLYAIWRFIIEFYRGDEIRGIALLSTSQWISLIMLFVGIFVIFGNIEKIKIFNTEREN